MLPGVVLAGVVEIGEVDVAEESDSIDCLKYASTLWNKILFSSEMIGCETSLYILNPPLTALFHDI